MISLKTEINDDIHDELDSRCPKCNWYFSTITKPYILPCNHNICLKCMDSLIDENKTLCPLCDTHFNKEDRNSFQINLVFLNILLKILQSKIIFCKNCNKIFYWKEHYNICDQSNFRDTTNIFKQIKNCCEETIRLLKLFDSQKNILFKYKKVIYDSIKKRMNDISDKFKKQTTMKFHQLFLTSKKLDFNKTKKEILSFLELCLPYKSYFNSNEILKIIRKYDPDFFLQRNNAFLYQDNRGLSPIQTRLLPHSPFSVKEIPTRKMSTIMIQSKIKNEKAKLKIQRNNNNITMDKYDNLFNKMLNDNDKKINHLNINNINAYSLLNHRKNFYEHSQKSKTIIKDLNSKTEVKKNKFNIYDILNEKEPNEANDKKKIIIGLKEVKIVSDKNDGKNKLDKKQDKNILFDDSEISTVRLENPPLNLLCSTDCTKRIFPLNANDKNKKLFEYKINKKIDENNIFNDFQNNSNFKGRDKQEIFINKANNENNKNLSLSSMNKLFKHFNKINEMVKEMNNFNEALLYISDYINREIDLNIFLLNNIIYNDYNLLLSEISYNYNQYPRRYILSYINHTRKLFLYNTILNRNKTKDFEKVLFDIENFDDSMSIDFNDDDLIFITGGVEKSKYNCSNKFIILKWSTEKIEYKGNLPNRKAYHSTIYFDNKLYLIGGINSEKKVSKDCLYFSLKEKKWQSLPSLNKERANCSLCIYNNKILYAFRGRDDNNVLDTIEYIKLNNIRISWKIIKPKDLGFIWNSAQNSLVMTIDKEKILILGGEDKNGNLYDETILFEINTKKVYKGIDLALGAAFKSQGCINQGKYFCADFKNEENNVNMSGIHVYSIKENIWSLI